MRYIEPPNQILRYALIQGLKIDSFAQHVGSFIAVSLFHTSALALDGGTKRQSLFYIILIFNYYSCLYYFPSHLYRFFSHIIGLISTTFILLSSHSSFNYISILFFTFRNFNLYTLPRLIFSIYCLFILPPHIYIFFHASVS